MKTAYWDSNNGFGPALCGSGGRCRGHATAFAFAALPFPRRGEALGYLVGGYLLDMGGDGPLVVLVAWYRVCEVKWRAVVAVGVRCDDLGSWAVAWELFFSGVSFGCGAG